MVQLQVFRGETAGCDYAARRFPFRIGRAAQSDLRLEFPGVWDEHLELRFDRTNGFLLVVMPKALAAINGEPVKSCALRNGDVIEIGALKIRFWLGNTNQSNQRWREWLTWAGLGLVTAAQIMLIYRLLR